MLSKITETFKKEGFSGVSRKIAKKGRSKALGAIADLVLRSDRSKDILAKWMTPESRTYFEALIFDALLARWFEKEYWSEPDPDKRVKKQELLMGGQSGAAWAASYEARPFDPFSTSMCGELTYKDAYPTFQWLAETLKQLTSADVYQMGSSSGREIAYYAKQFPQHRFFGTDLFQEVVAFSSKHYPLDNLKFDVCPLTELVAYITKTSSNKDVVIFSSGSFQYAQPEHLDSFFQELKKKSKRAHVFIIDPANEFPLSPFAIARSYPRGNFSWTHNYKKLAEDANFKVVRAEIIRPYLPYEKYWPNHQGTVSCALYVISS